MASPFVIFALPRSRSRWLASFLSYPPWHCGHDELRHCRSLDDVRSWLRMPYVGTVETAAAPFWRLLPQLAPDARIVTLRRPIPEVVDSLAATGITFDPHVMTRLMERYERKLDQVERRLPGVLAVSFADLADEDVCSAVFEHCLQLPHDHDWWGQVAALNLQVDLPRIVAYYAAHEPQLTKLAKVAAHRCIAGMRQPKREEDGVTFAVEPFRKVCADAEALIADHMVQIGQAPGDHLGKNLQMLELLDDYGCLQTLSARCNGRLFGYLVTIIGPSLDVRGQTVATHTAFFTSPAIRGLGMRMLRAATDVLRERGVNEIQMRAGVRGDGPRVGTLYRRLGAESFGELYRLPLGEV